VKFNKLLHGDGWSLLVLSYNTVILHHGSDLSVTFDKQLHRVVLLNFYVVVTCSRGSCKPLNCRNVY